MTAVVAICGPGNARPAEVEAAAFVARRLAEAGATIVCGGLGGVMDAAARGAREAGGTVVGILPGPTREGASPHLSVALPTGMGEARNALVARAADVLVAIGGGPGTLSEIAFALKLGTPVVGLDTWELAKEGAPLGTIERAVTPEDAVRLALRALRR